MALPLLSGRPPFVRAAAVVAGVLAGASFIRPAAAVNNEPAAFLSPDPSQWPAPAKPYFMLAVDTSSSMGSPLPFQTCSVNSDCTAAGAGTTCTCFSGGPTPCGTNAGACNGVPPPCAGYLSNRNGYERCALENTIEAFAGQVNFGMSGMALQQSGCTGAPACTTNLPFNCFTSCTTYTGFAGDSTGCGPEDTPGDPTTRHGANILVPMLQDHFWQTTPPSCTTGAQCPSGFCSAGTCATTNVPQLLQWVDNSLASNKEIWAKGQDPLNGMLRDMYRYFAGTYVIPGTATAIPTPLDTGSPSNERACRSVNVILITAGDENCDTFTDATNAAANLYNGVTVGGLTFNIRTHVIAFVGGKNAAVIAGAGASSTQTGATAGHGYFANPTNYVALSQALSNIIGSAVQPETCDNVDNNCNGCTDEGFTHYCDQGQTCCNLPRATCLANYQASITPSKPQGDTTLLPCTDSNQGTTPATWLCNNPGDTCDGTDNNCNGQVDEGATKCGSPLHCPVAETCNGVDDDCDGIIDNGPSGVPYSICPNMCQPSPEICDGCDNNCNGSIDDGVSNLGTCGLPPNPPQTPSYCTGTLTCVPGATGVSPGSCNGTGGTTKCTFPAPGPQPETCNGIDDDCNGKVDDGIASTTCFPPGTGAGTVFNNMNPLSRCQLGQTQCINGKTQCVGGVGPQTEVCNGLDDDCDGKVDDNVTVGVGQPCGSSVGTCKPGTTACVSGAIVCQGGVGPGKEVCDGLDNDCNGLVDDGMLGDAPPAGMTGCWDLGGACCSYTGATATTHWCPPPGGTCNGLGSLTTPCGLGTLTCAGASGWVCKGAKDPGTEVCNGRDDDCDGSIDEAPLPAPVGSSCGSNVGTCKPGVNVCMNGTVVCNGVGPMPEVCDGLDNDCNGTVDDNVPGTGVPCNVMYDTVAYPGNRNHSPCRPGVMQCDSAQGMLVCLGGVGPQPEICDGLDNDCDGAVDELGTPPDGITGTTNPKSPGETIGQACGNSTGVCMPGMWACGNGLFVCSGGVQPSPEKCDCADNDCDGTVDNPNPDGGAPLCGSGKDCVKGAFGCGCAAPCGTGEFPCPGGQICATVTIEGDGGTAQYCVHNPCPDCETATVKDGNGNVTCAPNGSPQDPSTCLAPPVCVCAGQNGCQAPCFGVTCAPGTVCTNYGANAGKCVADNCTEHPCVGCGKICVSGMCQQNPCTATTCPPGQECKPNPGFNGSTCVTPCATVTCGNGQVCVDGTCVAGCNPACGAGMVCDTTQSPPACVADKCGGVTCMATSCCDPLTGACGACPCDGIVCPTGSTCQAGQCVGGSTSNTSSSSSGSGSGSTAVSSSSSNGGMGGGGTGGSTGVFGLATGGGGCACVTAPGGGAPQRGGLALAALALAVGVRRRRREASPEPRKEVAR